MTLPLYLLTKSQSKMWVRMPGVRRVMAQELARRYPTGCGVLIWTWTLPRHIANVDPRGNVHELPLPHRQVPHHAIVNKPQGLECSCAELEHPEYGEWRNHPDYAKGMHHPFCQFDPHSSTVYREVTLKRTGVLSDPEVGKVRIIPIRPDEYDRARERAADKRRDKTGPRS